MFWRRCENGCYHFREDGGRGCKVFDEQLKLEDKVTLSDKAYSGFSRLYDMYNGIGLQTARGSGTNGYVQTNLANLLLSKKRVAYNSEADIKRAEAEINKQPNKELLEHNRKRHIELKCADFEMLMENKGFDEAEIQKKVNEYRKLLQSQVASGELDIDAEMDNRDTHVRAKAAIENRDRMRSALGIKDDFVDGTSFEKVNKSVDSRMAETEKDDGKRKKKKSDETKKRGKRRKTESSSSSSSSSSSEESSSDDCSESSSDSDDSSTNSVEESSESNSSEVAEAKVRKKVEDLSRNGKNLPEKTREPRSQRREIRRSCDRRNDNNDSDFSDREKRRRRDSSDYYDTSHRRQRHNDDNFEYRRSGRSYGYDDEGRHNWYSRRYDRRNNSESDRHRRHDHDEKRYREEEKRSRRRYHNSSDSDNDRKQKRGVAVHNDDEGRKQLRRHSSSVEEKKYHRAKLEEVIPDTKEMKVEPELSSHSGSISSQKISISMAPPLLDGSNRNARNKTPVSGSGTVEMALLEKQSVDDVKMDIDVQESEAKMRCSIKDKEKVERRKRWHSNSSEIHDSLEKKSRHDARESEDGNRSISSSNDEFLHGSDSTHSSTITSNGSAAGNILNENSDEIYSPFHSPESLPETKDQSKELGSRERKVHSSKERQERSESDKSMRKRRSRRDCGDKDNYRRGSRGRRFSRSSHRHLSRLESDHDRSESNERKRHSGDFRKHRRHHAEYRELKSRRSESYESRRRGYDRSASSDRMHKLSRRKSHSNDSLRKRHRESRSRSRHSKRQISGSSNRSRHCRKYSNESRRSAHHIRKSTSVSSRKRSSSPKSSATKRSSSASKCKKFESPESGKSSESTESSSEKMHVKRRRHDTSSSEDEEDSEGRDGKRSHRSSRSNSRSLSSKLSVEKTGKQSNDLRKKGHRQRASPLREPIEESD
uniref:Cwf21 domain-containing protein n=1 Tax=Elaeophora elaphi TaxID=1147741 RepID=A0A0R3RXK2_9BILA